MNLKLWGDMIFFKTLAAEFWMNFSSESTGGRSIWDEHENMGKDPQSEASLNHIFKHLQGLAVVMSSYISDSKRGVSSNIP